jgi:hypothetical protein
MSKQDNTAVDTANTSKSPIHEAMQQVVINSISCLVQYYEGVLILIINRYFNFMSRSMITWKLRLNIVVQSIILMNQDIIIFINDIQYFLIIKYKNLDE